MQDLELFSEPTHEID